MKILIFLFLINTPFFAKENCNGDLCNSKKTQLSAQMAENKKEINQTNNQPKAKENKEKNSIYNSQEMPNIPVEIAEKQEHKGIENPGYLFLWIAIILILYFYLKDKKRRKK